MKNDPSINGCSYFFMEHRIVLLRCLVCASLIIAAAIVGAYNYMALTANERDFALSQYRDISDQAFSKMTDSFRRMNQGTKAMAIDYKNYFPNATAWPFVALPGFYEMTDTLTQLSSIDNFVFNAIVPVDKIPEYEDFMYDYYDNEPRIPRGSGMSPAGRGIWATDHSKPGVTAFYHDTKGYVYQYESTHNGTIVMPAFQISFSADITASRLGFNGHCDVLFGIPLDRVMDCVNTSSSFAEANRGCAFLTSPVVLPAPSLLDPTPKVNNMQAFIFHPVVLSTNTTPGSTWSVVGTVVGAVAWKTLLSRAVPAYITGMDCVVTTTTTVFTYTMVHGEARFQDESDTHDSRYTHHGISIDLLAETDVNSLTPYQLTMYPRRGFFEPYETNTPLLTTIGAIAIIIFCIVVFMSYDLAIRRESTRKELVLDTKRRFVRFISHEMRTPMNTVHLGLKLLDMEMRELSKQLNTLNNEEIDVVDHVRTVITSWMQLTDDILGNSENAVDVLNDLLNYDKIEMGTLRLEFSQVVIWNLVKKTTNAFVMQSKQKNVGLQIRGECWHRTLDDQIEINFLYDHMHVVGDSTRIAQVLRNLLSNALKFTPEDGKIEVTAAWDPQGLPNAAIVVPEDQLPLLDDPRAGSVRISVTDSGAGLSEDQLAQICSEGVQFNANELQAGGGSGLGLYISKGLAQQHGGSLTVTSPGLGLGSTFTLELPLFKSDHDDTNSTNGSYNGLVYESVPDTDLMDLPQEAEPREPLHVLVVDDAESNRTLLMRILTAKGYTCTGAEDGQQAIDAYMRLKSEGLYLDAIVMDFEMPVMNGPTATKVIRDLGCTCFIAGVTGNVLPVDIDHFKAQGANVVIAKPLNTDVLESLFASFRMTSVLQSRIDANEEERATDARGASDTCPLDLV